MYGSQTTLVCVKHFGLITLVAVAKVFLVKGNQLLQTAICTNLECMPGSAIFYLVVCA